MAEETLVQSSLAWSFLLVWEKLIPKDKSLLICSKSVFREASREAYGFFFTLAASFLAASWAAISSSATVSALTSGRVEMNWCDYGWWWCLSTLRLAASVLEIKQATAKTARNFMI